MYVDGRKAGEMRFPAGEVDLTALCPPGGKHVLSLLVVAMPLQEVMLGVQRHQRRQEDRGAEWRGAACAATFTSSARPPARASTT